MIAVEAMDLWMQCEVGEVKTFTVVRALARHRVLDISLGPQHSCVLVEPGLVYTLGCNSEAQLGSGSTRPHAAPISVKLFQQRHAVVSVGFRFYHSATKYTFLHLFTCIVVSLSYQRSFSPFIFSIWGPHCACSVLMLYWCSRKGIRPVKIEWWGACMVICLERGTDLHMAQLIPVPLTVSCFSKIEIGFTFLVRVVCPHQQCSPWGSCLASR